jgi:hypothetical protein
MAATTPTVVSNKSTDNGTFSITVHHATSVCASGRGSSRYHSVGRKTRCPRWNCRNSWVRSFCKDQIWGVKDNQGIEYKGAEVTSEGFHVYGLDPYQYYSAGYACYLSDVSLQQDSWDIWDNHMPITNMKNGTIVGFKYFGFAGLDKDTKGLKAFEGAKKGNKTAFNLFIQPKTAKSFKVNVWMDGPWDNAAWKGKKIGEIVVPANSKQEITKFTIDVAKFVEGLDKKHAIFLVAEGADQEALFDFIGLGFSAAKKPIERHVAPTVSISVNGKAIECQQLPFVQPTKTALWVTICTKPKSNFLQEQRKNRWYSNCQQQSREIDHFTAETFLEQQR